MEKVTLLTHADIPAEKLRSLRGSIGAVVPAVDEFQAAKAEHVEAVRNVPPVEQAPQDPAKRRTWDRKRARRLENEALCLQARDAAFETLITRNRVFGEDIEEFAKFTETLWAAGKSEGARRAALNGLKCNALWTEIDDIIGEERKERTPSFVEELLLKHQHQASRRHYTVRARLHSPKWVYAESRTQYPASRTIPSVPCMTFGEAEARCTEVGRNFDQKTSDMGFEVQVYDLVNKRPCGTSVVKSHATMPRAEA